MDQAPIERRTKLLALAAIGAALFAAHVPAANAATGTPPSPRVADRQLDRALTALTDRADGPPLAIAVIQRGASRVVHHSGVAALSGGEPVRARSRMRIASTSKAISGGRALALVSEGQLSLQTTIGELLPDQPTAWHAVTLAQLLRHTSGLPDFTQQKSFADAVGADPGDPPPPRALLEFVADQPLNFEPGTDYRYSNSDNIAVGLMTEAVAGRPYAEQLAETIFQPLRMGRSSLGPSLELQEPYIHGYEHGDDGLTDVSDLVDFGGWAWASGGVVSTPGNLNRYIRGYVGGSLFHGPLVKQQRTFVPGESSPPGPGRNSAGLTLFRYETNCGTVFGHTGSILGYMQLIAASPDGRRSLTFTISTQNDELIPALRRAERRAVCAALA